MTGTEDDLVDLAVQCEEDIVRILNERFLRRQCYVYAGDVLVTVNPWKTISNIEKEVADFIQLCQIRDKHDPLPPHPCCVAEKAVRNASDCVIIPLGESGSGKSRTIQAILHYLAIRSNTKEKLSKDDILAINEVLDLFCNARTLICSNSTRCLKVYEVFFGTKDQFLLGVSVKISLLDKLRVISQIKSESNFNIFYRLINGLNSEQLQEYFPDEDHRYVPFLRMRETFAGGDNSLLMSLKCLERIGLNEKEIEEVLHFVSAVILLGDLKFGKSTRRDVLAFQNDEVLEKAAMLLGVSCPALAELIITKSKKVKGHKVNVSMSCSNAMYECDRLAVICYETLIMWIERKINYRYAGGSRLQSDYSLVLLDAFGWENYSICSFEQLCINSVNEALQSTYNAVIFKSYEAELADENIYLPEPCLKFDLPGAVPFLFKPKGLLDVLHGSTMSESRTNDQSLLKTLDTSFKKEPRYINNNNQEFCGFLIEHFIGEVSYDIIGFAVQSKNCLNNNLLTCLKGSRNKTVSAIALERITRENTSLEKSSYSRSSSKKSSVVEKDCLKTNTFMTNSGKEKKKLASVRASNPAVVTMALTSLLEQISSSKVYFIRCLNSNLGMQPVVFDHERILRQVHCSNLYGTVKTRLACLKLHFTLPEFMTRYMLLFFHLSRPVSPTPELCHSVLSKRFDEPQFRVGKTKVFLSRNAVLELDENLRKRLLQIRLIQKVFRGFLGRKQYRAMVKLKNKYDDQRLSFFSEITDGISKFHDHLALQISEDQRRLKQSKLKEERAKPEAIESTITQCEKPVTSPGSQGHRMSYVWGNEVITDETCDSSTWCKVACFQRTNQLAMFSVKDHKITIDGTNRIFTTDRIGFNSFPTPSHDKQMKKVKACIGRGVQLYLSDDGSLIAERLCKNPIFVKGYFCEDKLLKSLGELSKNEGSKVFSYRNFIEKINYECHPARLAKDSEERCLAMCVVHLCFVKDSESDESAPCWAEVSLTQALRYVKRAVSLSMQQRREVQEKYHFKEPPALRMDSKMESTSAKILKLIRPSRYIETTKFKRKAWARKRVVSNPFLFGEGSFSEKESSSETTSPRSPDSSYGELRFDESTEEDEQEDEPVYENMPETLGQVKNVQDKWKNVFEASKAAPLESDLFACLKEESEERKVNQLESQSDCGLVDFTSQRPQVFGLGNHSQVKNPQSPYTKEDNTMYVNSLEVKHSSEQTSSYQNTKRLHQVQQHLVQNHSLELQKDYIGEYKTPSNTEGGPENLYENVNEKVCRNSESFDSRCNTTSSQENDEYSGRLNRATLASFGSSEVNEVPKSEATGSSSIINNFTPSIPQSSSFSSEFFHDLPPDIPSPDYMYNNPVYSNLIETEREDNTLIEKNEDMNTSWISDEEGYCENEYANYSSSSWQYLQEQISEARTTSLEKFDRQQFKHKM